MPTETVYGLAGDATQSAAVTAIFDAKERPTFDPLIVHVEPANADRALLCEAGVTAPGDLDATALERWDRLADSLWPGPLTLVVPRGPKIPDLVTSGLDTVAVRAPAHPVARAVLQAAGIPLAAPSANRFGRISPTRAEHVVEELGGRIPFILDGGACDIGVESTVVRIESNGALTLLRDGGLERSRIEAAAECSLRLARDGDLASPGRLDSHYAPRTRVLALRVSPRDLTTSDGRWLRQELAPDPRPVGLLVNEGDPQRIGRLLGALLGRAVLARSLARRGDDRVAAQALFAELRGLDQQDLAAIVVEPVHRTDGLWPAIADRLRRAAA